MNGNNGRRTGRVARWFAGLVVGAVLAASPARAHDPKGCATIILPTGFGAYGSDVVTSLSPLFGTSIYNGEMAALMYMPLIWIDASQRIGWSRSLASAITTPDNGTTYDVTLRPWHWSDGVPVSSADVVYALKLINALGPNYPSYGAGGMPRIIRQLNVIDATHFQVVLTHRVNPLWYIYNGLLQLEPLPAHSWGRYNLDQLYQAQSSPGFYNVVDGPLQVQRLDIGLDVVLLPNPSYQGPKLHFNRLVFKVLYNDGAAVQGIESGDLDMANLPMPVWNSVQHLPGIYLARPPHPPGWDNIMLNFHNPRVAFFRDIRVRDAIADAINQKVIVSLALHGLGLPEYGPVPPNLANLLSPAMRAGRYPVGYDPARSKALLAQAGFAAGPDGIFRKNGAKLSFVTLLSANDATMEQVIEIMQAELRAVGIDMKVRELNFNQILALLNGPPSGWQAAVFGEGISAFPTGELFFSTTGAYNNGGYSDPKMDALIAASMNQPGQAGLFAYEDYASAQQPVIFFPDLPTPVLARDRVHGIAESVDPNGNYLPDQWYCAAAALK